MDIYGRYLQFGFLEWPLIESGASIATVTGGKVGSQVGAVIRWRELGGLTNPTEKHGIFHL